MYRDRLVKVENNELLKNKKYFIFRSYTPDLEEECDIFTGKFEYLSIERHAEYDDTGSRSDQNRRFNFVHFKDLRNMVTLKKLDYDWSYNKNQIKCYRLKPVYQYTMENTYLSRILKGVIGSHFTHYLFEDINLDYELLEDNLVSDNKDYEIYEVFRDNYPGYLYIIDNILNVFKRIYTKCKYTINGFKGIYTKCKYTINGFFGFKLY